jgi:hypothetical protein
MVNKGKWGEIVAQLLVLSTQAVVPVTRFPESFLLECLQHAQQQGANQCGDQDDLHRAQAYASPLAHDSVLLAA